jgi:hypothetical protein
LKTIVGILREPQSADQLVRVVHRKGNVGITALGQLVFEESDELTKLRSCGGLGRLWTGKLEALSQGLSEPTQSISSMRHRVDLRAKASKLDTGDGMKKEEKKGDATRRAEEYKYT